MACHTYLFPARGRKRGSLQNVHHLCQGSHLPFPRKGTETSWVKPAPPEISSHTYLFPARGRKHGLTAPISVKWNVTPTFSPQGDGNNKCCSLFITVGFTGVTPTFSPQGDGNARKGSTRGGTRKVTPTFSPQGDGNSKYRQWRRYNLLVTPTFSPQGDGNLSKYWQMQETRCRHTYLFPARGRKLNPDRAIDITR